MYPIAPSFWNVNMEMFPKRRISNASIFGRGFWWFVPQSHTEVLGDDTIGKTVV